MAEDILFSGQVTFDDAVKARRLINPKKLFSVSGTPTLLIILAITVRICAAMIHAGSLFVIGILAITAAFVCGLVWLMNWSLTRKSRKSYLANTEETKGSLSREKLQFLRANNKQELAWDFFNGVKDAGDLLMLVKGKQGKQQYVAFAPYMFQSEDDWERCKQLVHEKIIQASGTN
jgi:hypothetical protein